MADRVVNAKNGKSAVAANTSTALDTNSQADAIADVAVAVNPLVVALSVGRKSLSRRPI